MCNINETILFLFYFEIDDHRSKEEGGGGGGEEKNEHFLKSIYQAYFLIRAEFPRIITFCNVCFIKIISFVPKKNFRYTRCTIEFIKVIMIYESDIVTKLI